VFDFELFIGALFQIVPALLNPSYIPLLLIFLSLGGRIISMVEKSKCLSVTEPRVDPRSVDFELDWSGGPRARLNLVRLG
jgi:hypothetical protein